MKENWIISEVCIDTGDDFVFLKVHFQLYCEEHEIDDEVSNALGYRTTAWSYEMEEDDYYRFPIPSWAICYLVNADPSGLSDEDFELVREFDKEYRVVDVAEESEFAWNPAFGLASDCYMCKCVKHS